MESARDGSPSEEDLLLAVVGSAEAMLEGLDGSTACSTADPEGEDVQSVSVISLHSAFSEDEDDDDASDLRTCNSGSSSGLEHKTTAFLSESLDDPPLSHSDETADVTVDPDTVAQGSQCYRRTLSNPSLDDKDQSATPSKNRRPKPEQQQQQQQVQEQLLRTQIKKRKQPYTSSPSPLPTDTKYAPLDNPHPSSSEQPVVVLGVDISHLSPPVQFLVCASGVFGFNLTFGFLQEFVTVEICNRELGLFLAMMQFTGYTIWSYVLRNLSYRHQQRSNNDKSVSKLNLQQQQQQQKNTETPPSIIQSYRTVPIHLFVVMGLLSAIDMAMTNMALHYINYPAKTLMKSCRVVFTMFFGILLVGKQYRLVDYVVALLLVAGLAIFMQADASSSAIFKPMGVFMLTISLLCDGATNIMSETTMKSYGIGQDELIFRMFSLALIAVTAAATFKGDLHVGLLWLLRPGTYDEWKEGVGADEVTWSVPGKIAMIVLFSSMGFFGSSCSAAITKNFGALAMSMTSTARRATTLFISFFMFDNECTYKHVAGVTIFMVALSMKSVVSRSKGMKPTKTPLSPPPTRPLSVDLEMQKALTSSGNVATGSSAMLGRRANAGKS